MGVKSFLNLNPNLVLVSGSGLGVSQDPDFLDHFFIFYFKLSYSKFARDLKNTLAQIQNPNTQKIESPNPNLNLWVFMGAYVWLQKTYLRIFFC